MSTTNRVTRKADLVTRIRLADGRVFSGALPTEPRFYGVENEEIQRFELCEPFAEHQALVDETTAAINAGEIELPEGV